MTYETASMSKEFCFYLNQYPSEIIHCEGRGSML